jgi:hypothetical protein
MASEKLLEKKTVSLVKLAGGLAVKLVAVSFTGLPDRLILLPRGRVCFIEFKSTGKKLSSRQVIVKTYLESIGFTVYIIDTDEALNCFKMEML